MNTTAKALLISTALSLPMAISASAQTDPSQLQEVLSANLSQLNVSTVGLEMLSTEQMLELDGIIGGSNTSVSDQRQQAEAYLAEALPATTTTMPAADAMTMDKTQLETNLMQELSSLGVDTTGLADLTTEQMLELQGVLGGAGRSNADRKQGAETYLSEAM